MIDLRWTRLAAGMAALVLAWTGTAAPAAAHPHVMVNAAVTVNIVNGSISSITHVWTFDEFYTAQALDGLPKNKDGLYGRPTGVGLGQVPTTNRSGHRNGLEPAGGRMIASESPTGRFTADPPKKSNRCQKAEMANRDGQLHIGGLAISGRQNRTGGLDTKRQPDESISTAFHSGVPKSRYVFPLCSATLK